MPELGELHKSAVDFGLLNPSRNIDPALIPDPLPPDLREAAALQGKAAMMGIAAKTLASLPDTFAKAYSTGMKNGASAKEAETNNIGLGLKNTVLGGGQLTDAQRESLQGVTIGADGSSTMRVPSPEERTLSGLKLDQARADLAYRKAQTDKATRAPSGLINPLVSDLEELPTASPTLGKVTAYGYSGDHYGGPKATSSTTGAMDNTLDNYSMALSPDMEKVAAEQGLGLGDWAVVHTDRGDVLRRFDDRTAQWDPTGEWSVDDKGNFIKGENGERLPALKGRWDFRGPADGSKHPMDGVRVSGFTKVTPGMENFPKFDDTYGVAPADDLTNPDAIAGAKGTPIEAQGRFGGTLRKVGGSYVEELPDRFVVMPRETSNGQPTYREIKKPAPEGDENAKLIAQSIIQGRRSPELKGMYKETSKIAAELEKQGYNHADAMLDWTATNKYLSQANSRPAQALLNSIRTARGHLDMIDGMARDWDNGRSPIINRAKMILAEQGGLGTTPEERTANQTQATTFKGQLAELIAELAVVYKAGNSPTNETIKLAGEAIDKDWSRESLLKATETLRKNLDIRENSFRSSAPVTATDNGNAYYHPSAPAEHTPTPAAAANPDQEALNWLKANATDPRAAGIRAALQAKGVTVP